MFSDYRRKKIENMFENPGNYLDAIWSLDIAPIFKHVL